MDKSGSVVTRSEGWTKVGGNRGGRSGLKRVVTGVGGVDKKVCNRGGRAG